MGFADVDEVRSGEEALKKLGEKDYALIITGWYTSPMNGLELLIALRYSSNGASTPVIVITASGNQDKVLSAHKEGPTSFLVKPFSRSQLGQKIDEAFRQGADVGGEARESADDRYLI